MILSTATIETLTDLVEIKLSSFEVWDRQDKRELIALQNAREELREAGADSRKGHARSVPAPSKLTIR